MELINEKLHRKGRVIETKDQLVLQSSKDIPNDYAKQTRTTSIIMSSDLTHRLFLSFEVFFFLLTRTK